MDRNLASYFTSILHICVLISPKVKTYNIPQGGCEAYSRQGDINIGVLLGIHSNKCQDFQEVQMQTVEGIVHAIDTINNDKSILPNITLGFIIQDDCGEVSVALACAINFAPDTPRSNISNMAIATDVASIRKHHYNVAGVVGPIFSKQAIMVASFLDLFEIPVLGVLTTSDELSDKSRYEYFSRVVPPDYYSIVALVTTLEQFNWTYVSVVYSEGSFGENAAKQISKLLPESGICVASTGMIPIYSTGTDIKNIVDTLKKHSNARVVILFLDSHGKEFFQHIIDSGWLDHFIWIGQLLPDTVPIKVLKHLLIFAFPPVLYKEDFRESFLELTPSSSNPWVQEFWRTRFFCQWEDAKKLDHCSKYPTIASNQSINFNTWYPRYVEGIWSMTYAMKNLFDNECPQVYNDKDQLSSCLEGSKLLHYLRTVSYVGLSGHVYFDEFGDIQNQVALLQYGPSGEEYQIADWDQQNKKLKVKDINWEHLACSGTKHESEECDPTAIPESVCAHPCGPKQYYQKQELPCCWECKFCRENEIIINDTSCQPCPLFTWPEETNALSCLDIEPWTLSWGDPAVISMVILATLGAAASISVSVFYMLHKQLKLIKASSIGLSMMTLSGLLMAYILIYILLSSPSKAACLIDRLGFNVAVTITYGPLLVKTNRIYRIFSSSKKGNQRPTWISSRSQVVFSALILAIQLLLSTILLILYPATARLSQPVPTDKFVESLCFVPLEGMLIPFLLNAVLICACAVYGFLTRRLPENFNESWYLFIAVSTTMFLWLAFLPTYFAAFYAHHQTLLMCSVMFLSATIILCCLYVPKVYAVFYVDENQLKVVNPSLINANPTMAGTPTLGVPGSTMNTEQM